jgi:hypothetical protein
MLGTMEGLGVSPICFTCRIKCRVPLKVNRATDSLDDNKAASFERLEAKALCLLKPQTDGSI